jgi:epimerase transport system membrane fusion protein
MKNIFNQSSAEKKISSLHGDDKPVRNIGLVVLLLTFGVFGVWSFTAPIGSSAAAPGTVVVKAHRKTVQHLEGGIVAKLLAKDGDIVKEGQAVLILDDTQAKADREMMRGQFIVFSARLARLVAERDRLNHVEYPKELDTAADLRVSEAKHSESDIFISRKNAYDGEISVLKQRIVEIGSKIDGLQGQIESKKELVASYSEEIHDLKELLAEGFADKLRLRDIQRNHARTVGEIAQLKSDIATAKMQQSETRLQILQIQKKFQEEVTKTLSETQAQLYEVAERLNSTEDKLKRKVVKAPADGMVLGLSVHTEGGVIAPGNPILDIVPQDSELTIDAKVSPIDIDRVTVGLKAQIRFSAFKQALIPIMEGKVTHVSADSFTDEKTGVPFYKVTVEITPESLAKLNKGSFQLVPGMPADVLINTGERTFFEYLAQPVTNVFAHAFIED